MFNLLSRGIFKVRLSDGTADRLSLPSLMSALAEDRISSMSSLRAHQGHAFHAFLSQLAVIAMVAEGVDTMPTDAARWRQMLRGLTGRWKETPWHLVRERMDQPAFMQPPIFLYETDAAAYKHPAMTPESLDVLVSSLNHEVKRNSGWDADLDDWAYALINTQTMSGYTGRGYYAISRMFSGYGCRTAISLSPPGGMGARVARDALAMLEAREDTLRDYPMTEDGIALMWLEPWSGAVGEMLDMEDLDPYYIEVSRRIRLVRDEGGRIYALKAGSGCRRVDAADKDGVVGDPWLPVNTKRKKSLNLGEEGFTYRRLTEYITDESWAPPLLLRPTSAERGRDMDLVARGMKRGEGKTDGYFERQVPMDAWTVRALVDEGERKRLGEIARERIEEVSAVAGIMGHALAVYFMGDRESRAAASSGGMSKEMREKIRSLSSDCEKRLDDCVDPRFFASLQAEYAAEPPQALDIRKRWLLADVVRHARSLLSDNLDAAPGIAGRYRNRAQAMGLFEGWVRGPKSPIRYIYEERENDSGDGSDSGASGDKAGG